MKRKITILLALCIAGSGFAQEVIKVRLKDGTELQFPNGIETTDIHFWGTAREGEEMSILSAAQGNEEWTVTGMQVADYTHQNNEYGVALVWMKDLNMPEAGCTGICIGRTPDVTMERCDSFFFENIAHIYTNYFGSCVSRIPDSPTYGRPSYVLLGDSLQFFKGSNGNGKTQWNGLDVQFSDLNLNWCNYPLERGQTYYYRVVAIVANYYIEPGSVGQVVAGIPAEYEYIYYGPEHSFRIPNLKEDAGYTNGDIYFSDEAWATFLEHFPSDMTDNQRTALTTITLPALLHKWEATLETSPYDLSTATDLTFDNGIVHLLPAVPDAFWEWMSTREIVIGAGDTEEYASSLVLNYNEYVPGTSFDVVADVDATYGVPNNSYLVCNPVAYNSSNRTTTVHFNLTEALPGVNYKLTLTLAPETRFTPDAEGNYTEEERIHFQPAPFQISLGIPAVSTVVSTSTTSWGDVRRWTRATNPEPNSEIGENSSTFVATDALRTIELEGIDVATSVLQIQSTARASQITRGTQTSELRIAEVRLTPILPTE
ncbi:MAG: hypothetical protein IJ767_01335 [Bacteroidaceae bacterium]|nr:hypothetical protein [Bacteroidaceae bacterium]